MDPILHALQSQAGIHFMGVDAGLQVPGAASNFAIAMDAQPALVTTSNSGIPAFLSTWIDPKIIEILVAPMKAAEIAGEEIKKGDWTTKTAMFPDIESTGEVSAYGDYNENGSAGANVNFPQRQSYHYQVITQWGEMQLEEMGLARIDWSNRLNISSVLTLNKFQNQSYFFGIKGLENFGILNDPSLLAPLAPVPDAAAGGAITWGSDKTALGVLADVAAMFSQLQTQANGLVDLGTKMTLAMSPVSEAQGFTKTNNFNVNVFDLVKKNYPNLTVKTAPEYATASGNLVQLFADELEGQRTLAVAFTEKLRAHPIRIDLSSFKQKKSQGTWGSIIWRPFLVVQMLGV
jgi:hypothetical protein